VQALVVRPLLHPGQSMTVNQQIPITPAGALVSPPSRVLLKLLASRSLELRVVLPLLRTRAYVKQQILPPGIVTDTIILHLERHRA
jgi:hypothetical protein